MLAPEPFRQIDGHKRRAALRSPQRRRVLYQRCHERVRFDGADPQVAGTFITPVNMVFDEATSELFILELRGQIQQLKIN